MLGAFRSKLTQLSKVRQRINSSDWQLSRRKLSSTPVTGGPKSRLPAYARRTGYLVLGLGTTWAVDKTFNASAVSRNFMTLWTVSSTFLSHLSRFFNNITSSSIPFDGTKHKSDVELFRTVRHDIIRLQIQFHPRKIASNPRAARTSCGKNVQSVHLQWWSLH
jgi:hypothetical protein